MEAIQAALEIQANVGDLAFEKDARLSVKIGFGIGKVKIIQVGGIDNRVEYLPVGASLSQAFEAEHLAEAGGVIIIPSAIKMAIQDVFETEKIMSDKSMQSANGPFYYVKRQISNQIMVKAAAQLLRSSLERSELLLLKDCVMSYIFPGLMPFVEFDNEGWFSNLGEVTTLFASIGVDLSSINDRKGLVRFNEVIKTIQKCIYQTAGSLNKLLMDDKGTTMIAIWNAHDHYSQEATTRAVTCAKRFVIELEKQGVSISVGIATGNVFAGVVGASGGRREYSILGDGVNLSARLMQAASKSDDHKIFMNELTALKSRYRSESYFNENIMVKGKSKPIATYFPVCQFTKLKSLIKKKVSAEELEKNPFLLFDEIDKIYTHSYEYSTEKGDFLSKKSGKEKIKSKEALKVQGKAILASQVQTETSIKNLVTKQFSGDDRSTVILVSGESGLGKSFTVKSALDKFKKASPNVSFKMIYFTVDPNQYNEKFDALINLYTKVLTYQRILQANYDGPEAELIMSAIKTYLPSKQSEKCLSKMQEFLELISEWQIPEIRLDRSRNILSKDILDCCNIVLEALLTPICISMPLILCLDSAHLVGKTCFHVLKHLCSVLKITVIIIYTTKYKEHVAALTTAELKDLFQHESIIFEHIVIKQLDIDDGMKLCDKFAIIVYNYDIEMDKELSRYVTLRCEGNRSDIISFLWKLGNEGFFHLGEKNEHFVPSAKFIEAGDESFGQAFLEAPLSLVRLYNYVLNNRSPAELCVVSYY